MVAEPQRLYKIYSIVLGTQFKKVERRNFSAFSDG